MSYTSIRSVLVLLLIPPFCFAQGDVANELTRGEGMLAVGDRESARKSFEAARRQAEEIGDHQLEAAALIGILRTIDANFQSSPDLSDPARHAELDEAREMEKKALRIGSPAQRQAAINALGVLFLRAGMQAQALDTLSELDMQNVLPSERYIYEYNVGRALERNEHPREAFDRYVDAIGQQPTYCPSIAGALRLLHSHVDHPAAGSARVCEAVLNSPNRFADDECFAMGGRKDTTTPNSAVDSCLDTAILEWGGTSGAEALLHVLVNRYADTGLEETSFNKHMVTVKQVTEGTSQWNDLVGGLRRAYDGTFAATFSPPAAHKEFPAWTTSQQLSRDLSRLLTRMGETKESNTSDDQSASVGLSYYATAWGLDHSNAKAALHAATVLQNHPDIAQRDELTMSLVNESVPGKTEKEDENWPQLVRLHLVLGDILSSTGECGSDANSASPLYQYEKALALEKKNRPNDAYSRSPELNRRLADCYKRLGNGEQAAKFNKDVVLSLQQYRPLTPTEDKLRYHIRSLWYPGGIMKSGVQAGLLMALDTPEKWHQGPAGFFRRFANSHATRAVRQGLAFGLDSTLHEDPHFLRSPVPGFRRRFLYSIKQTFLCQNDELSPTFATFRVGSAFGSEFISNAWRPSGTGYGDSNTRGAVLRALAVLGGDTAGNVFQEFITQRGKIGRFFAYVVNK